MHDTYFHGFKWTEKGVVRKRFETVQRKVILKKNTKLKDLKHAIQDAKDAYKELVKMVGPLPGMKRDIQGQKYKYEALSDMEKNYKQLFKFLNED